MTQDQDAPQGGFILIGANALYEKPERYARIRIEPDHARTMHRILSSVYANRESRPLDGSVYLLSMKMNCILSNTHPISMTINVHDTHGNAEFTSLPITQEQIENGVDTGYLFAIDMDMIAEIGEDWIVDEEFHNTVLHKAHAAEVYSFARDVGVTPLVKSTVLDSGSTQYIQRMNDLLIQVMPSSSTSPCKQAASEVSP